MFVFCLIFFGTYFLSSLLFFHIFEQMSVYKACNSRDTSFMLRQEPLCVLYSPITPIVIVCVYVCEETNILLLYLIPLISMLPSSSSHQSCHLAEVSIPFKHYLFDLRPLHQQILLEASLINKHERMYLVHICNLYIK